MAAIENSVGPVSRGRVARVASWAVQILLALLFAFAGVSKLLGLSREVIEGFARLGGEPVRLLVGAAETLGAIGLVVPRLAGAAAVGLAGVMVGAVISTLALQPPAFAAFPAAVLVVLVVIARARRDEIAELVESLRS